MADEEDFPPALPAPFWAAETNPNAFFFFFSFYIFAYIQFWFQVPTGMNFKPQRIFAPATLGLSESWRGTGVLVLLSVW